MDEATLFAAHRGSSERWVIRELPSELPYRYYVQDADLGYCTDPMTFGQAIREARDRNRTEEMRRSSG